METAVTPPKLLHRLNWRWWIKCSILAFGCWYISHALEWNDAIAFPPRHYLPDGHETIAEERYPIIATQLDGWLVRSRAGDTWIIARDDTISAVMIRPGLRSILEQSSPWWLAAGFAIMAPVFWLQAWRWWLLLGQRRIHLSFLQALRIHFLGLFCGNFLPGMAGGDLVKAYEVCKIVKRSEGDNDRSAEPSSVMASGNGATTADAIISVVVDRILGFAGFVLMTAMFGVFVFLVPALHGLVLLSWLMAATYFLGIIVILVRNPLHRLMDPPVLVILMPAAKVFRALFAYRDRPMLVAGATIMSIGLSSLVVLSTLACGKAVGIEADWRVILAGLPFVWLVGILPLSFLGFGVMEPLAVGLFTGKGASPSQIIAMLVITRVFLVVYSLPGAWGLISSPLDMRKFQS